MEKSAMELFAEYLDANPDDPCVVEWRRWMAELREIMERVT